MKLDLTLRALFLVVEQMPKPRRFLFDTFFDNRENTDSQEVQIEFKNGRRLMAPMVARHIPGQEMPKEKFTGRVFKPYKIDPKKSFLADELTFERQPGENPFLKDDPDSKRAKKIAETMTEQVDQISRRWEKMAAEVLYTLKLTVEGKGVKDVVDYTEPGKPHIITVLDTWDSATSNPINDLKGALRGITADGGERPTAVILDPKASDLFQNNKNVKEIMNLRNYYVGQIKPETENTNGVIYIGTLTSLGLDIYEYQEYYDNIKADGTTEVLKLVPEYTALLAPKGNIVKFAAESTIKNGILQGDLIPRIFENEENDSITIRTTSKPVMIPINTKSLKVLKVK